MKTNIKVSNKLSQEDMNRVNEVFENECPYQAKSVGEFFDFVKNVRTGFEELSASNKKIKAYLRLWKGASQKFYQEIVPFEIFLKKNNSFHDYKVQISADVTPFDTILFKRSNVIKFEIVTAYINEQEIYRTHHLNENGWVGGTQTYTRDSNGDLIADNELEMVEITAGLETEALIDVMSRIKTAVNKKQQKKYKDTHLLVVTGHNAVFNENQYAIARVKQLLVELDNGTFKNIYVLDYELPYLIKLRYDLIGC